MKFSKKVLIGLIVFILLLTSIYTIMYIFIGGYPTEIYLALIPTCISELILLYKLEIDDRNNNKG